MKFMRSTFVAAGMIALALPMVSNAYSYAQVNYYPTNQTYYGYSSPYYVSYSYVPVAHSVTIGTPYYGNTPYYGSYPRYTTYPQQNMGYVGYTDFWGRPQCYWQDYGVSDCSYNPHQWLYDPYTGTWY